MSEPVFLTEDVIDGGNHFGRLEDGEVTWSTAPEHLERCCRDLADALNAARSLLHRCAAHLYSEEKKQGLLYGDRLLFSAILTVLEVDESEWREQMEEGSS